MALTRRQREVLDVVREFIEKRRYSPSLEEIGEELGLSSVATVHKHVSLLVEKGYVRRAWNQNRSIELTDTDESTMVRLPLCGSIAAGRPLDAVETDETVCVPADMVRDREVTFALRVQGDSMVEDLVDDGDILIIERRLEALRGQMAIIHLRDRSEATLKRIYPEGERVRLQPAHPTMPPFYAKARDVQVQGQVVAIIRQY